MVEVGFGFWVLFVDRFEMVGLENRQDVEPRWLFGFWVSFVLGNLIQVTAMDDNDDNR